MPGPVLKSYPSKRKQGYTLIEIVTALAVFTIIVLAITQILGRGVSSYRETKKIQANLETAQFALNLIAKELRTSSIVEQDIREVSSRIEFYDYSQGSCIQYVLDEGLGQITRRENTTFNNPDSNVNRTSCAGHNFGGAAQVVFSGLLDQAMNVVPSISSSDPSVGRVTFVITVGTGSNAATLQTSISLRDYNYIGL